MQDEIKVEEKNCKCDDTCKCGCQEGQECTCNDKECNGESGCKCDDTCKCGCQEGQECTCSEEECNGESGFKCDDTCECGCQEEQECTCENVDSENCNEEKKKKGFFHRKHEDKLNEAYNKISELEDKLIRQNAEVINYRKRREEEYSRMMKFCNEGLIKDLLPVIDNFERALKLSEGNDDPAFVKLSEGYKMVYCGLENILTKFDVKAIDGANKPFDPVYHNAVMLETKENVEPGMVIEVLQKGYLYKDKVIRPAMVKVSE